jgi:hypothetical protein
MKIPFEIPCNNCKQLQHIFIDLADNSFQGNCSCGADLDVSFGNNATTGYKLLRRSQYELKDKKDYSLSIVLSAAAFECELSRLYFKWTYIGRDDYISDSDLEEQLRCYKAISTKIEEITKLMDSRGFTCFVKETDDLRKMIDEGFPSLNVDTLSKSFQEKLFWPRNRILHLGDSKYGEEDAIRSFNIATLGLRVLDVMDGNKRKTI